MVITATSAAPFTAHAESLPHTDSNTDVSTGIIIFAKYPALGMAKTRLQPALGKTGAAEMARRLLLDSIEQAVGSGYATELCVSPAATDACWKALELPSAARNALQWSSQVSGDLGARMLAASQRALQTYDQVLLMGTDCPSLTASRIKAAASALMTHNAVMIPALDGGYVLLGFKQAHAQLFADMLWSTDSVAAVTQQRIAALQWSLALLPPLRDIDEPADLAHLPYAWLGHVFNSNAQN